MATTRQWIDRINSVSDVNALAEMADDLRETAPFEGRENVEKFLDDKRRLLAQVHDRTPEAIQVLKSDAQSLSLESQRFSGEAVTLALDNARSIGKLMKEKMRENHHYGRIPGAQKESLWQPGADLILTGFRMYSDPMRIERTEEDGHYRYGVTVQIHPIGHPEVTISEGVGAASTREIKYAYRWVRENDIPKDMNKEDLKTKNVKDCILYRVENQDVGDLENTLIKMATKRAKVAAVMELPGCSELFME